MVSNPTKAAAPSETVLQNNCLITQHKPAAAALAKPLQLHAAKVAELLSF